MQHTILEFLSQGNTDEEKRRRKHIYEEFEKAGHSLDINDLKALDVDGEIAKIISFYDAWSIMVQKHYLPIKSFKGINGVTAVRLYYILEPYIEYRRKENTRIANHNRSVEISNTPYAENYEWLVRKLCNKKYITIFETSK